MIPYHLARCGAASSSVRLPRFSARTMPTLANIVGPLKQKDRLKAVFL
jgi:hypothetical protein